MSFLDRIVGLHDGISPVKVEQIANVSNQVSPVHQIGKNSDTFKGYSLGSRLAGDLPWQFEGYQHGAGPITAAQSQIPPKEMQRMQAHFLRRG